MRGKQSDVSGDKPRDDKPRTKRGTLGRRSYLSLLGATATGALFSNAVRGEAGGSAETDLEFVDVDYGECYDPSSKYNGLDDVYRVWNQRSGADPEIVVGQPGPGDRCLAHHFQGNQMTANTVYSFAANHDDVVEETYQRFRFHPNGMTLADRGTFRFFWAGIRNGPTSSGGTTQEDIPNGKDGWSIRLGYARRGSHDHPDEYPLFVYVYHMDQVNPVPELNVTDTGVRMNEWNDFRCHQVLNTVGNGRANADGEIRVWVNGELAFERTDYRWTSIPGQGIEEAGPHGYWWGSNQNGETVYFDDHHIVAGGVPENIVSPTRS
ncbi:hypothetical protein [Natronosalvus halobius]|uniref:hypothetical protein n=1 Tax=Natronosalvus halobius TaxID=2953746 RepID=UPI0020A19B87|nr:hypothetical protein [Natronosalvus halobius]USZ72080.1 hypothetical protein NGM15_01855 [Natronosalvus halobius]